MEEQDEVFALAERIRAVLPDGHAAQKRMFGGVTFLVKGNMLCCAFRHGLMLRVGTDAESAALTQPFVRRLSETRKMPGFVFETSPEDFRQDGQKDIRGKRNKEHQEAHKLSESQRSALLFACPAMARRHAGISARRRPPGRCAADAVRPGPMRSRWRGIPPAR